MQPFCCKEADLRFSEPRNQSLTNVRTCSFSCQEKHSSGYRTQKNGAGATYRNGLPKVLLGHMGRDPWTGHYSDWRAENPAREILCCCSTEPAGPKATHFMESWGSMQRLGQDKSSQHQAAKLLITSLPLPQGLPLLTLLLRSSRTGGGTKL